MQVSRLLQYSPVHRYSALQALTHPFFDELRDQSVTLPNGVQAAQVNLKNVNLCSSLHLSRPLCIELCWRIGTSVSIDVGCNIGRHNFDLFMRALPDDTRWHDGTISWVRAISRRLVPRML